MNRDKLSVFARSRTSVLTRHFLAVATVSLLSLFGANAAEACEFRPDDPDEVRACLARFCDLDESGERRSPGERALCVARVYDNWEIIGGCSTAPALVIQDCIRRAYLERAIEEAAERASRQQQLLAALAFAECARRAGADLQACFGPPRVTPPPPPGPGPYPPGPSPYFISILREMKPNARAMLHQHLQKAAKDRYEAELSSLKEAFAMAVEKKEK